MHVFRLSLIFICSLAFAQDQSISFARMDKDRETAQRATEVLKAMSISPGDSVADIGAGNGYFSQRLAAAVGEQGKVYAEDISDEALNFLNRRVKQLELPNIEVVKGGVENPKLPAGVLSSILIVDSYHHFTAWQPMLEQILHSLKPGGRLVILDYSLAEHRTQTRSEQLRLHEIGPAIVRKELGEAGFTVLSCEDPWVKRIPKSETSAGRADSYLIVAMRPKAGE